MEYLPETCMLFTLLINPPCLASFQISGKSAPICLRRRQMGRIRIAPIPRTIQSLHG